MGRCCFFQGGMQGSSKGCREAQRLLLADLCGSATWQWWCCSLLCCCLRWCWPALLRHGRGRNACELSFSPKHFVAAFGNEAFVVPGSWAAGSAAGSALPGFMLQGLLSLPLFPVSE